jgi:hypothetical protein
LKGKYTISPSLDFTYGMADLIENRKLIPDTVDFSYNRGRFHGISSRAGILFNTNKFYAGYSVTMFNQAIGDERYNPLTGVRTFFFESYIQLGYTFQKKSASKFSFTPQVAVEISRYTHSNRISIAPTAFNLNFRYKQFIWGLNNVGLHLGWQTDKLRLMVSNNYGFSTRDEFRYTGNLSFRYILGNKAHGPGRGW